MNALKTIAYIAAAVFIFFGVLFIWGAFSPNGSTGWIIVGIISVLIGLGLIFIVGRRAAQAQAQAQNVQVKIDLPGGVSLDTVKCKSCGGVITSDNISLVNGAPMVTCPYCHTAYQLTEEPKW
ncbi:hypothetical protein [Levilinea saccharolytica]|uniref:Uncharacterized protein n=1 Tax=Levilinea saccharolytica TaxID=229921 RepID=A0A0P6X631_9CHLR|nr:hypothetical protein [Levilinea saccharolytica]KPL78491.1 hypothetical protein ADN01_14965 [Levilinea saccharolytica]GAP18470.1 hypothetical protein LSAC_02365 [Levilinea saccharolytica]